MNEDQIADVWSLFKDYLDKKQVHIAAEKFVDLLADYGVTDSVFRDVIGNDKHLDAAINYYLELDSLSDEEDWD